MTLLTDACMRHHAAMCSMHWYNDDIPRRPVDTIQLLCAKKSLCVNSEPTGFFLLKIQCYLFSIIIPVHVIFLYETGSTQWTFSQHCRYWWPALAPGHQYLQCCVVTHGFTVVYGLNLKKKKIGWWNLKFYGPREVARILQTYGICVWYDHI